MHRKSKQKTVGFSGHQKVPELLWSPRPLKRCALYYVFAFWGEMYPPNLFEGKLVRGCPHPQSFQPWGSCQGPSHPKFSPFSPEVLRDTVRPKEFFSGDRSETFANPLFCPTPSWGSSALGPARHSVLVTLSHVLGHLFELLDTTTGRFFWPKGGTARANEVWRCFIAKT